MEGTPCGFGLKVSTESERSVWRMAARSLIGTHGRAGRDSAANLGRRNLSPATTKAVAQKVKPQAGTLLSIMRGYQASEDFRQLADRTRLDYVRQIKIIESEFGDFPLSALTDRRSRRGVHGLARPARRVVSAAGRLRVDCLGPDYSRGRSIAGLSRAIPVRRAGASIAVHGLTRFGPPTTSGISQSAPA